MDRRAGVLSASVFPGQETLLHVLELGDLVPDHHGLFAAIYKVLPTCE